MQKTYTALIGFGLIVALTFGIGFKFGQNSDVLKVYTQSNSKQQMGQQLSFAVEKSNQVAAVLLMPKSYVPLLEKFKHRKIARAIKILPANIKWDDGQMVAIPQKAIFKDAGPSVTPVVNISHRSEMATPKTTSDKSKMTQGAAFLFLLKGAATNKFRYTAGQSTVHKTGL